MKQSKVYVVLTRNEASALYASGARGVAALIDSPKVRANRNRGYRALGLIHNAVERAKDRDRR